MRLGAVNLSKTRAVLRNISRYIKAHGQKTDDEADAIAPARRVVFACDASVQDSASFCVNSSANALRSVPFRGYEGLKWASVCKAS